MKAKEQIIATWQPFLWPHQIRDHSITTQIEKIIYFGQFLSHSTTIFTQQWIDLAQSFQMLQKWRKNDKYLWNDSHFPALIKSDATSSLLHLTALSPNISISTTNSNAPPHPRLIELTKTFQMTQKWKQKDKYSQNDDRNGMGNKRRVLLIFRVFQFNCCV